ncbi:hypothetical protein [Streptomyces sp. YIM 98790]|uniref:hypothetical protein n=1 Tax=Streptomyces sp. YIM 98790 TaxID=2689077 RepID=UPI001409ED55|nr:hypothetical protein [Streptomyces sp. YIM 98790]
MSDPLSMVVVGAALPAAFGFLFQHLHRVIDRRAARRAEEAQAGGEEPEEPIPVPACVAGDPGLTEPDPERVERNAAELERLSGALSVYERRPERLTSGDERLLRELGTLRDLLEEIYGRRITFRGEQRPASGAEVDQRLRDIQGRVKGVVLPGDARPPDRYVVRQDVERTGPDSEVIAVEHRQPPSGPPAGAGEH